MTDRVPPDVDCVHTLDGVGPHTKADLRYVASLKREHGIDYDTHASYRFVER